MKQLILDLAWAPLPPFAGFLPGENAAVVAQLREQAWPGAPDLPLGARPAAARRSCCANCRRRAADRAGPEAAQWFDATSADAVGRSPTTPRSCCSMAPSSWTPGAAACGVHAVRRGGEPRRRGVRVGRFRSADGRRAPGRAVRVRGTAAAGRPRTSAKTCARALAGARCTRCGRWPRTRRASRWHQEAQASRHRAGQTRCSTTC